MEYYVTQPKDYWIAPNAINITLNALGDKNRIQCSVVSGAVIMCFLEDVKPASQGGDPENGDGLYYGVNHEPKRWPLSISPTFFNNDAHKYVYVAIPRSEAVGTQAVIVFPSEELDIYGRARRLLTSQETGEPLLNEDGEQQVSYEQIGSTDYFYIYLNGIISAPAVNAATGREERGWERIITDWGKLETAQGREERQNSNEWFSYSQVNQVVTFLKEIIMGVGSSFRNLILNHKNLTDVATSETDYTDSDTMVATPGYVEKHYLSKSHDDSTPYSLTVGGILRAATGYITSLYSNLVQSTNYTGDGIADTGYRLTADHNGHSKLTIDEIYVRMKAVFESLEVRERTYAGGDQIWSCAGNRINRVDYLGNVETADHAPEMMDVHADGRPAGTGEGDVYSVPVPGDTYGYSYVKVPWLLRQMPFLLRHKFFGRLRRVRIILNEQEDVSGRRAGDADSQIGKIRRARCYFLAKDDDMEVHNWWRINDLARCQTMNLANTTRKTYLSGEDQKAGNIFWWRKVIGVSYEPVKLDDGKEYHYFDVAFDYLLEQEHPEEMATSVMEGSDIPAAQDSVVQFGNTIIEGRMNLMMMEVNGGDAVGYTPTTDAPCLKAYRGIYCFDLNKCWVGGSPRKMMLSPKSGYEFYGPNFKQVTEYDVVPVPVERGLWLDIVPTRDDYREHEMVRKCYYYDKVSHNGSYWLCSIVDGAHWVDGNGDYISDAAYSALTEAQKALCSRKQNYTIEEPSADSIDWTEVVKRGDKGDNMIRLDINNEMDMIPTTAALRIDVARTVETTVRLFDGATEVDISAATLSPSGAPAGSIATFSQAADGKGKKLSWAFKAGQTMAAAYDITVSYTYKNVAYTAVFTVSASKGEAVWQLKPSLSAIPFQRNADNTLTPASRAVGLSLVKIDGGSTATYTSVQTGLTVRYSTSSMPSSASAGTGWESGNITVANTDDNLYIALFNAAGTLLDRETVPVVKDGENGFNTVRLDINNEMDMIPTTAALRIDVARTVETTVRLFDGATEVDISAATLSPSGGPASSIATFSQAADGKGKKLSWAFKVGQTMAEAYDITISYTYKSVIYTEVFTVSASKGEAVWQLKPSLSAIPFQRNADNTLTPASRAVGLSLVKIDGGSTATYTSVQTGLTVRYSTSSMPSSASAGTGWESGNITVANTADNLYIALFNASGVLLDRETIPVVKDGENGSNVVRLDINNEMDMIPTTAALRIDVARTVETTVRLFDGATEVDISAATLSPSGAPAGSIATFSQAADGKGKKLSWAFKAGQTMAAAYDITVSYTYKNVAYTAVFTVSASKGEAVWQLKPSLSAIPFQRNADNTLTPASRAVGLSLVKIDGGSTATYTSVQTGLTVRYSTSSMPSSASAGSGWSSGNITVANTADNLYIALFNASGVLLDRETIPVIKDGEKGTSIREVKPYYAKQSPESYNGNPPQDGWEESIAALGTIAEGWYVWTKNVISFTDNVESTTTYTVSKWGIDGDGIENIETKFYEDSRLLTQQQLSALTEDKWKEYSQLSLTQGDYIYTRTRITYDKGDTPTVSYQVNRIGQDGVSYLTTEEYYCLGNSATTPPTGHPYQRNDGKPESMTPAEMARRMKNSSWRESRPTYQGDANKYIWNFEASYDTTTNVQVTQPLCIGDYSKGISTIVETYTISSHSTKAAMLADTAERTAHPWVDEVQDSAPTDELPYQWNKTVTSYSDGTSDTFYHVSAVKGTRGRGITNTNIYYKADTTTPLTPSGDPSKTDWVDDGNNLITDANANKHLYESTCTTYSNGTYSWTEPLDDGLISDMAATSEEFALSDSSTTAPTEGWNTSVTPTAGKWLWSRTVLTFKNGKKKYVNTQCVGYCGTDGNGIASITKTYAISAQGTTANDKTPPSDVDVDSWSHGSPATTDEKPYLWAKEVTQFTDSTTDIIYYPVGKRGDRGIDAQDIEWVFIRTKTNVAPVILSDSTYKDSNGNGYTSDDHLPHVNGNDNIENNKGFYECTDDPKGVNGTWKYEWEIKRSKGAAVNGRRSWNYYQGEMTMHNNLAESAFIIDTDNDNDQFGTDSESKVLVEQTRQTTVSLYDGSAQQTLTSLAATLTYDDNTSVPESVATVVATKLTGVVAVTVKKNNTSNTHDEIRANITAECSKGTKTITFTIRKVMGGAPGLNPVIYQLAPTQKVFQFSRTDDNTLTPPSRSTQINVAKTEGNTTNILTTAQTGVTYSWGFDESSAAQATGKAVGTAISISSTQADNHHQVWVELSTGDRETLPIVKDGENGKKGDSVAYDEEHSSIGYAYSSMGTPEAGRDYPSDITRWYDNPPAVQKGKYLWTKDVTAYNNAGTIVYTTTYGVQYQPNDGESVEIDSSRTFIKYCRQTKSQYTGQHPADSNFSTTYPTNLGQGDYLWILNQVAYVGVANPLKSYSVSMLGTDGSKGDPGADGYTTHFAYATSADGSQNFSTTNFNGATYIGTYRDRNAADSTDYRDYVWTPWKGDKGEQGEQGEGGYGLSLTPTSLILESVLSGNQELVNYVNNVVTVRVMKGSTPVQLTCSVLTGTSSHSSNISISSSNIPVYNAGTYSTVTLAGGINLSNGESGFFTVQVSTNDGKFSQNVRINFYVNRATTFTRQIRNGIETAMGAQTEYSYDQLGGVIKTAYQADIQTSAKGLTQQFTEQISRAGADGRNLFGFAKGVVFGAFQPFIQGYGIVSNVGSDGQAWIHHLGFEGKPGAYTITFQARMLQQSRTLTFCLWGDGDVYVERAVSTNWQHYELHFNITTYHNDTARTGQFYIIDLHKNNAGVTQQDSNWNRIAIRHLKIERSTEATNFCEADEDVAYLGQGNVAKNLDFRPYRTEDAENQTVDGRSGVYRIRVPYLTNTYPWGDTPDSFRDYLVKSDFFNLEAGKCYTLSFWAKSSVNGFIITQHLYRGGYTIINSIGNDIYVDPSNGTIQESIMSDGQTQIKLSTTWTQYFVHFYVANNVPSAKVIPLRVLKSYNNLSARNLAYIYMSDIELQEGYVTPTDYFASFINQNARRISLVQQSGTKLAGIDIQNGTVNLMGDRVTFSNSTGTVSGKVWIDPTYGTLHAQNGVFAGTVNVSALYQKWQWPERGSIIDPTGGCGISLPLNENMSTIGSIYLPRASSFQFLTLSIIGCVGMTTRSWPGFVHIRTQDGDVIWANTSHANDSLNHIWKRVSVGENKMFRFHSMTENGVSMWIIDGDESKCSFYDS